MTPSDFGFPPKFSSYREAQLEALHFSLSSDKRVRALALPVGSGKSLFATTLARHYDRTAILTITKGLQQQYADDFESSGLIKIEGRTNYVCDVADNCKLGGHLRCTSQKAETCPYIQNYNAAKASSVLITNYAYWLNVMNKGQGIGEFDCLILDEAHDASKALESYLDFNISESDIERFELPDVSLLGEDIQRWMVWAGRAEAKLKGRMSHMSNPHMRALEQERLEVISSKLSSLQSLSSSNWVCEEVPKGFKWPRYWKFNCIWPGQYIESLLQYIPNIFLMSGTLRPSSLGELGIKRSTADYRSWPRTFPPNRSPFYSIKSVPVKYKMSDEQTQKWLDVIDEIIESRYAKRKGIIHTVSYARQRILLERSKFRRYMLGNTNEPDSEAAAAVVSRFRSADSPAILVSPSFGTGWDFPAGECEWQILTNIPFPPMQSKVMRRRKELDPTWQMRQAAKEIGQQLGRGMRFEKDRCENFIVDDRIGWFVKTAKKFLPEDFSYYQLTEVPTPGPRWNEK